VNIKSIFNFSLRPDHSARRDSTQLNSTQLAVELSWVELSRVGRVIMLSRALWSLSRRDSTQLTNFKEFSASRRVLKFSEFDDWV